MTSNLCTLKGNPLPQFLAKLLQHIDDSHSLKKKSSAQHRFSLEHIPHVCFGLIAHLFKNRDI